jgi:hypothetical protein
MITKLGSKTYLDEVTYQYDKFVKAILNATKDFSHSLSLDKENILSSNIIDKLYFNMDNFDFYGLFSKEIPARSTLMDILKRLENILREEYQLEGYAGKVYGDKETYHLFFDIDDSSFLFATISLEQIDDKYYLEGSFPSLKNNLEIITKNVILVDCLYQVGILKIKYNEEGVSKTSNEISECLSKNSISNIIIKGEGGFYQNEERIFNDLIPLILEVGPSNLKKHQLTLVSFLGRKQISEEDYLNEIIKLREEIKKITSSSSLDKIFKKRTKQKDLNELKLGHKVTCCLNPDCVNTIVQKVGADEIIIPFNQIPFANKCIVCLNNAREIIIPLKKETRKN